MKSRGQSDGWPEEIAPRRGGTLTRLGGTFPDLPLHARIHTRTHPPASPGSSDRVLAGHRPNRPCPRGDFLRVHQWLTCRDKTSITIHQSRPPQDMGSFVSGHPSDRQAMVSVSVLNSGEALLPLCYSRSKRSACGAARTRHLPRRTPSDGYTIAVPPIRQRVRRGALLPPQCTNTRPLPIMSSRRERPTHRQPSTWLRPPAATATSTSPPSYHVSAPDC